MGDAGKQRASEKPLAWGRHGESGALKHIHQVPGSENGAACGCTCPGCGGPLVAVNADKDGDYLSRPGTLRPFFKHGNGKQHHSCLIRAARAAAMQMLMEQGSVWLPPRRARDYDTEALGHLAAALPSVLAQVVSRRWVDSLTGVLTLEDGSEVLVTAHVNSEVTHSGKYTKVIRIECSDPLVATMKPEEVITLLRDPKQEMLCWQKHDDDDRLNNEAAKLANDYLDGMPPELVAGLSKLHANETILHWLIKEAVRKSPFMRVPGASGVEASRRYPHLRAAFEVPETVLEISEPRLEKWTGQIVPDIVCKAKVRGSAQEPFDLLIEAAVHNKVGAEKLKKIQEMGVAAIEIRSDRFSRVGLVKASVLSRDICNDPSNKRWLHNPMEDAARSAALAELRTSESALIQAEARKAAAAKWHADAKDEELYGLAFKFMRALWLGAPVPRSLHPDVSHDSLRKEILDRTGIDITDESLSGKYGLLAALCAVEESAAGLTPQVPLSEHFANALRASHWQAPIGIYLLMANECWQPLLSAKELASLTDLREVIEGSYKAGILQHVRRPRLDKLVGELFPQMRQQLGLPYGTQEHASALHDEVRKVTRERERRAEAERTRLFNEEMERQRLEQLASAQVRHQELIDREIAKLDRSTGWCVVTSQNRALEDVVRMAQASGIANNSALQLLDVVHAAWHARNEGRTVGFALRELDAKAPEDLSFAVAVWKQILMARTIQV